MRCTPRSHRSCARKGLRKELRDRQVLLCQRGQRLRILLRTPRKRTERRQSAMLCDKPRIVLIFRAFVVAQLVQHNPRNRQTSARRFRQRQQRMVDGAKSRPSHHKQRRTKSLHQIREHKARRDRHQQTSRAFDQDPIARKLLTLRDELIGIDRLTFALAAASGATGSEKRMIAV